MTRVCDMCQPTVDGALDTLARNVAKRAAAEGTASIATDLVTRWVELVLEEHNTPDQDRAFLIAGLMDDSQHYLLTAPLYALTVVRATSTGGGSGEAAAAGKTTGT